MPYLNLDFDFLDHPKTVRLVSILGRGAESLPLRLWAHCGRYHARNGDLSGYTVPEIEGFLKWWGKPGVAVDALVKVGFMAKKEKGYFAHDWRHHQGHIHALKVRNKKVALNRWKKARGESENERVTVDTSGTNMVHQKHVSGVPLALPFHALPNQEQKKQGDPVFSHPSGEVKVQGPPPTPQAINTVLGFMAKHHQEKRGAPLDFDRKKHTAGLERIIAAYGPVYVMAAWEMWFYAGETWSEWAAKSGHGLPGFCAASGIGAIAGQRSRLENKALRHTGAFAPAGKETTSA